MPTVLRINGFRLFFFSNEGKESPHIHVEKGDGYAKLWLEDPVRLQYSHKFTRAELRDIRGIVTEHAEHLKEKWNEFFGNSRAQS